jgi:Mlc titration factor MtfA (ptsG expression regulator)
MGQDHALPSSRRTGAPTSQGHHTFLDPYGAENPAEFFAVCVETFFELPGALRETHPDIHRLFAAVFGTDPEKW